MCLTLKQVLLQYEVFPPRVDYISLKSGACRSIIIETRNTTIDFEGRGVETTPIRRSSEWRSFGFLQSSAHDRVKLSSVE
jgi:hypothetical protein